MSQILKFQIICSTNTLHMHYILSMVDYWSIWGIWLSKYWYELLIPLFQGPPIILLYTMNFMASKLHVLTYCIWHKAVGFLGKIRILLEFCYINWWTDETLYIQKLDQLCPCTLVLVRSEAPDMPILAILCKNCHFLHVCVHFV